MGIWCWELCLCSWVRWIFGNRSLWPVGRSFRFFSSLWCGCCRNQQMISIRFCCSSSCSFCCLVKISRHLCSEVPCCAYVDDSYRVLLTVSLDFTWRGCWTHRTEKVRIFPAGEKSGSLSFRLAIHQTLLPHRQNTTFWWGFRPMSAISVLSSCHLFVCRWLRSCQGWRDLCNFWNCGKNAQACCSKDWSLSWSPPGKRYTPSQGSRWHALPHNWTNQKYSWGSS